MTNIKLHRDAPQTNTETKRCGCERS